MDAVQTISAICGVAGGTGMGYLLRVWLGHREKMDGNFAARKASEVTAFTTVNAAHNSLVTLLTAQVASMIERSDKNEKRLDAAELAEAKCQEDRDTDRRQHADNVASLQSRLKVMESRLYGREIVLLIEDNELHRQKVCGLLGDVLRDNSLTLRWVTDLPSANGWVESACCVIADVILEQSGETELRAFIAELSDRCEVVVYAGSDYPAGTFPKATVVSKLDDSAVFVTAVERAVKKSLVRNKGHHHDDSR